MYQRPPVTRLRRVHLLLLLLIPFLLLLVPGLYNFDQPELVGIPFFYWFQALVLLITAGIITLLFRLGVDYEPRITRDEEAL